MATVVIFIKNFYLEERLEIYILYFLIVNVMIG
jgi:hypothetical protein